MEIISVAVFLAVKLGAAVVDTAAGQAVCEAAGCEVIDQNTGKPMLYNRKELLNGWFLVSRTH